MNGFWTAAVWDVFIIHASVMKGSMVQKTGSGDVDSLLSSAPYLLSNFGPVIPSSGTQFAQL